MEMTAITAVFEKYPIYKDSGVEWLGGIPEHWKLLSNKNIFKLKKNQVGKRSADFVLLSLTLRGIIKRIIEDGGKFPAEFDTYQEVKRGDFVFCLFDVEETPRCVGLSDFDGMITGAYTVMGVEKGFDKTFLYYFYLNLDADKRLRPLYTGLRNTISKDSFLAFKTFVPPLHEQTAIAQFLDDKTAKIDQAIARKEKLIALLKERKQIIIQDLVTGKKVWNPTQNTFSAPSHVKPSGVEWIGEIPEGWAVSKLKYLTRQIVDGAHFTPTYVESGVPFLRVTDISNEFSNEIDWLNTKYIPLREHRELIKRAKPEKGDVLLSKNGTIGITRVVNWDVEFSFFVSLCLIKLTKALNPYFFCQFFDSPIVDQQVSFGSSRTSVTNLHLEKIKELLIVLPPIEEQLLLVVELERINSQYKNIILSQLNQIEKLKELKLILIDAAVTGKIKII